MQSPHRVTTSNDLWEKFSFLPDTNYMYPIAYNIEPVDFTGFAAKHDVFGVFQIVRTTSNVLTHTVSDIFL